MALSSFRTRWIPRALLREFRRKSSKYIQNEFFFANFLSIYNIQYVITHRHMSLVPIHLDRKLSVQTHVRLMKSKYYILIIMFVTPLILKPPSMIFDKWLSLWARSQARTFEFCTHAYLLGECYHVVLIFKFVRRHPISRLWRVNNFPLKGVSSVAKISKYGG
jgi:hypothetical protein